MFYDQTNEHLNLVQSFKVLYTYNLIDERTLKLPILRPKKKRFSSLELMYQTRQNVATFIKMGNNSIFNLLGS